MCGMNRLLLASIAFAVLQVSTPRGALPADVAPGQGTRLAPRLEAPWPATPERVGRRTDDAPLHGATPAVRAAPAELSICPAFAQLHSWEPGCFTPVLLPSSLPDARAPPIQS